MARSELDRQIEEGAEALFSGVGRFLSGWEMDGVRRTNATFVRAGTRVSDGVEGRVGQWSYRPYWQRSALRLVGAGGAGGGAWSYWQAPEQTLDALTYGGATAAGLAVAGGIVHGVCTRRQKELMREWVEPLHQALVGPLGIPAQTRPRSYLHVPLNFADDEAEIRIDLPVNLQFNEQVVSEMITKKLALQGVSFSWKYAGKKPYVKIKKVHRPPNKVVFSDAKVRELIKQVPESAPLIGLERGEKIVSVDLDAESPHVLVSAGTGGGKSVILRTIAAQLIHHGAHAHILDFKRVSHQWARGVPNVNYCRDIADIHDALIALGAEGRRRIHAAEQLGDDADSSAVGPRVVILLEEINATMKQLTKYWERTREKDEPKSSPAVDALAEILFMGRAVRMHVLLVAQSATARALGGPEMRENFATRILARYTQNAWRMLVPEVHPAPKSTRHIGRAQVVLGGVAHETQVCFMTDAEARAWAMAGARQAATVTLTKEPVSQPPHVPDSPVHLGKHGSGVSLSQGETDSPVALGGLAPHRPGDSPVQVPLPARAVEGGEAGALDASATPADAADVGVGEEGAAAELLGLRQAQEKHFPDVTLAALRRARSYDPEFPSEADKQGSEKLYRISELKKWARNRPRAALTDEATDLS
ncbi:pRL2-11 [Streptomyces sp. NPDC090442]|uniref:pRL2-11 n=1 Tax=Streptomyces sp. NPDC090442 TaxID=3365962 RepID=UPI0038058CAB